MYLADYHLHSRISPDAGDSMTALAEAAVAAGLDELCFTDHVEPIAWASTNLRESYEWSALTAEFDAARDAMGDRIKLRLGIELGDACWDFAHTEKLLADAPPWILSSAPSICSPSAIKVWTSTTSTPRRRRRPTTASPTIWAG